MMLQSVDQTKGYRRKLAKSTSVGHTIFENEEIKRISNDVNSRLINNTKIDVSKDRRSSVPLLKNINSSYGGYSSNEGDNIKVYVRIRPPHQQILEGNVDTSTCLEVTSPTSLTISTKPEPKQFSYDHVAHMQTTQEEVFATVGKGIIEAFVNGFNGTIFAYGQTGSGKTFTMLGPADDTDNFSHELRGVIPRGFEYLFSLINRQQEKTGDRVEFLARCSFLEIYNEQVFDLLEPSSASLHLRENLKKGVFVADLAERDVSSAKDAYDVLQSGWTNRRVASTSMNRESSRSHAVFTVTLESKKRSGGMNNIKVSKLHLVDLAGSERQKDTHTQDLRLKEAGSINKSLSALGNVIMALVDIAHGKTRHVHYRDSKLTFILRDSLGGNAKTYIIANVHPSSRCFGETLSTLNFARRAKMIKNKAVVNEDVTGNVSELQSEIRRLKELLAQAKNGIQPELKSPGYPSNIDAGSLTQEGSNWKEMMLSAIAEREQSENEKNALQEKVVKLEELCSKKEKFYQSTKMILKFRNDHIVKLERMLKKELGPQEETEKDKEIKVLKEEIKLLQSSIEHHPEVKRFAMENLELRAEIKRLKRLDPSNGDFTKTMAEKHRYTLQLERQLHDLMSSQSNDLEKSLSSSQQSLEASNAEIEKMKMDLAQVQAKLDTTQNELVKSRQEFQEQSEKLISFTETSRKKELELQSDLAALRKSNNELERTLEILQIRTAVERTAMNSLHMQTIKTLSTPRKFATPQKNAMGRISKQSTPVTKLDLSSSKDNEEKPQQQVEKYIDKDKMNNSKNSVNGTFNDEKYINDPERLLEDEPPPRILQRKDSFNDVSDDEDDVNPFWDFANETKDDEVVYIEALQDEIRHQQKLLSDALQRHYEEQKSKLPLIQNIAKLDHKVNDLEKLLTEERSIWSSKEMELVSQLTSLRDSYKETQGNATILKSELDDIRRLLQVTEKQLDLLKKEKKGEVLELERMNHSMQQEVVNLKIHNMNLQAEVDKTAEDNNNLQTYYEECKEELHFTKDNNSILEKDLIGERQKVKDLQQELQSVIEKLHNELDNKVKLSQEDKEHELLKSVETINVLREELSKQAKKYEEQEQAACKLQSDLDRVRAEFTTQKWCSIKDKDAISKFMVRVEDFKKTIAEKESTISSLTSELDEIKEQYESSLELCNGKKKKIQKLTESLKIESDKFSKERMEREKEVSSLQDEIQTSQEHCKELQVTIEKLRQQLDVLQTDHIEAKKTIAEQKNLILMSEELNNVEGNTDLDDSNKSDIVFVEHEQGEEAKKQLLNVSRLTETYKAKEIEYVKEIQGLKRRFSEFEMIESRKEELESREKILEEEIELLEGENASLKDRLNTAEQKAGYHREEIDRWKKKVADALESEKRAQQERSEAVQRRATMEVNLCSVQDDLETNIEELERTKELEQKYFEESNFYRSRVEVAEEEKKRYEEQILRLNKEKDTLELENSRLNGHRNHSQKIEYVTNLKKENNSMREKLQKLTFELNKMSGCEKCRRHDS